MNSNLAIALQHSQTIDDILRPLKEHFGVTRLVYAKNYNDGSEIRLTNQPTWVQHYYEKQLYLNSGFELHPQRLHPGFVVLSHLTHHQPILKQARDFDLDNSVTLMQKTADACEMFFLSTATNATPIANNLLNNLDVLHRFTYYFKEHASDIIKTANQNRIVIPQKAKRVHSEEQNLPHQKSADLSQIFALKQAHINTDVRLSAREITCAKLFAQGKSARLIGEILFLSPRTVETHLMHLREKLNCHSKAELIRKIFELNLHVL